MSFEILRNIARCSTVVVEIDGRRANKIYRRRSRHKYVACRYLRGYGRCYEFYRRFPTAARTIGVAEEYRNRPIGCRRGKDGIAHIHCISSVAAGRQRILCIAKPVVIGIKIFRSIPEYYFTASLQVDGIKYDLNHLPYGGSKSNTCHLPCRYITATTSCVVKEQVACYGLCLFLSVCTRHIYALLGKKTYRKQTHYKQNNVQFFHLYYYFLN